MDASYTAPNVWRVINHCYESPELCAKAQSRFAIAAVDMFRPHAVEISASSAGKCALELWAFLHGRYDLPENHVTELAKMDGGTLYGARIAGLFAAGYEDLNPGSKVLTEVTSDHDGIPGHIDISIPGKWVVEVKTSFWTREFSGPPAYHIVQAAKYALGQDAPGFSIFTMLPGAQRNKGVQMPFHAQTDFVTSEWALDVDREYSRLARAASDTPPTPDAKEPWRCSSCRFSACPQNKNPLKLEACPL